MNVLQVTDKEAPSTLPKFLACVEAETTDDNSRTSNQTQKTSTKIVLPNKIKDLEKHPSHNSELNPHTAPM